MMIQPLENLASKPKSATIMPAAGVRSAGFEDGIKNPRIWAINAPDWVHKGSVWNVPALDSDEKFTGSRTRRMELWSSEY
jgi:hypothetical protein